MPTHPNEMEVGIDKAPTGIEGFDEITKGGIPRGRTVLVMGTPGSGKTVFALQTLVNGARQFGEPGIFVAFEEQSRQIIRNAATFGWNLPELEHKNLFFLDARRRPMPEQAGDFDLIGLLAGVKAKASEMGAQRIVFDSIDVLLSRLDDPRAKRDELYRIHDWLAETELTGIITTRMEGRGPASLDEYGFLQFMADCVVALYHDINDRVSVRGMRVIKYRGSQFAENEFPLTISEEGMNVAVTPSESEYQAFTERISTGVMRLDMMLSGGYLRGSTTLISGAPGTAKSTLAAAFLAAAGRRGERGLYVSFDEGPAEIVRNMASVGIDLASHIDLKRIRIYSAFTEARSAEEHLMMLKALIAQHQPQCMVIDPLSAMLKAGGTLSGLSVAQRLLRLTKIRGVTLVVTSLLDTNYSEVEASAMQVSTVADTWIQVSYVAQGGERNRALTIIKSRGTEHSNQVRELILSREGVTLADVYTVSGEVLMGTLRYEKEREEERQREIARAGLNMQQHAFEQADAELEARIAALEAERAARQAAHEAATRQFQMGETGENTRLDRVRQLRSRETSPADKGQTE